ncbi:germin-like protein 9-3 [Thalictrum thalictroides]|uniref:Germin-like protein n=1 Tax=Thalictrum thalictroides TaxID=46969 RepID=A0A7J6VQP0_THATH|nr:germin-like protein 9-3 [Thalictrum thalictroides]
MLLASFVLARIAQAGDPDLTSDFLSFTSKSNQTVDGKFFSYTGLRGLPGAPPPATFTITKATHADFPGLNGQAVSYAFLQFPANSINPLHTHPCAAELLYVLQGCLEVGLIDTKNNLYTQALQKGDMFVFPKGLVHYQLNPHMKYPAAAISAFGSANAGTLTAYSSFQYWYKK